ncbi:diguanylate cyclase [Tolumonas lignilytica]|uniref:diguanylate cyclase n=1 Tax=Tolumonas lignilytica TaxID=1283284 RepID=UPI000464A7EF|nr:diguanylate cyclase [Tolumonas lignilytica]
MCRRRQFLPIRQVVMPEAFAENTVPDSWWKRIIVAIGLGLVAYLNVMAAPQQPGVIASLWYVNALTIVTLLYHPACCRAILLSGYAIGLSAGYWAHHVSGIPHFTLMLANLAEILVAVYGLQRNQLARDFYCSVQAAIQLGVYGILLPPLLSATIMVAGFSSISSVSWSLIGLPWYINSVISSVSVMPLLLLIRQHHWNSAHRSLFAVTLLLLLTYTAIVLLYFPFPFVYLGFGLALIAIRYGIFGAALAGFLVSFSIALFIRMGWLSWQQYDPHLLMLYVYLPIMVSLIPPLLLAIFVDALHIREQQLLTRESMFRDAMEASAIGIALISTDGQLFKTNPALCRMLDYSETELGDLSWDQVIYPDDLAAEQQSQQQLLTSQKNSYRLEVRYQRKNGQSFWVRQVVSMVRDASGLPHYFVLQVEDIDSRRNSEERERELFNRYLLAAEAGQVGVWEWRPLEQLLNWDERMFDLYAIDRRYIVPSFTIWKSCVHPDDLPTLLKELDSALKETNVLDSEFRVIHKDNSIHYLRTHAMVERDAAGNPWRMVGTNWDITEIRVLMNDLSHERELLRTTLLSIGEAVVMTDPHVRVVFMNPAAEQILQCPNIKAAYKPIDSIMRIVDSEGHALDNPLHLALTQRQLMHLGHDAYLKRRDGSLLAIQDSAAPILRDNHELLGGVLVFSDVTEMRGLQKQLGYQASHDPLTGLVNRSAFEAILQDVVKESVMTAGRSALVFLDLDHFKQVNDTAGHAAGDKLLKQLATLMSEQMRASDLVARLGGDEFGLVLRNCSVAYAEEFMREVIQLICQFEFRWHDRSFHVGASAGLVAVNGSISSASALLALADKACYDAKRSGRGQVKVVHDAS